MTQHILIVDDEQAIRQMLGFALSGDGYRCSEAATVSEAQEFLTRERPDLILLDWMLPGISGVDFARRLKRDTRSANLPIIMLTAKGEEADKVKGLDSGADDYITKPFSTRELLARVRAVLRRVQGETSGELLQAGRLTMDLRTHRVTIDGEEVELSPTEFRLLQFFVTHPERVHSRGQLLDEVWGNDSYIEERTVDVHIRRLRKVLEPFHCEDMIQTVRSVGYRFSPNLR
ncbi:MAG: phosphate regulon transcriptional regulator PhoB [Gammaproteobacteria bacterium]